MDYHECREYGARQQHPRDGERLPTEGEKGDHRCRGHGRQPSMPKPSMPLVAQRDLRAPLFKQF